MSVESPRLAELHDALVSVLGQTHTTVDLAGGVRVRKGTYLAPPELPFCCVSAPEILVEPGRARNGLWEHTARYRVRCWVPVLEDDLDSRVAGATAIAEELVAAVEDATVDRDSFLYGLDAYRVAAQIDPVVDSLPVACASAELLVEIRYRRVVGTGA
jgi:hypothetical protein